MKYTAPLTEVFSWKHAHRASMSGDPFIILFLNMAMELSSRAGEVASFLPSLNKGAIFSPLYRINGGPFQPGSAFSILPAEIREKALAIAGKSSGHFLQSWITHFVPVASFQRHRSLMSRKTSPFEPSLCNVPPLLLIAPSTLPDTFSLCKCGGLVVCGSQT